jgi:hypothetical protein
MNQVQYFGDYVEPSNETEYITTSFIFNAIPRQQRWLNGGFSTLFLLEFWDVFFPMHGQLTLNKKMSIGNNIRFIANELFENLLHYANLSSQQPARFSLYFPENKIWFYITNPVKTEQIEPFKAFIHQLLTQNVDELYVQQVELSALDESGATSGIGFLTMINDYHAKLAWKFETIAETTMVTTMVEVAR